MMRLHRFPGSPRARALWGVAAISILLAVAPSPARDAGAAAPSPGAVTRTKTVSRTHLIDGKNVLADKRTITLNVDETRTLHDRQEIQVTWSGAHPTGNPASDPTSIAAADEEYPFVLLECRGSDSSTAPAGQRLRPETCWTQTPAERYLASPTLAFPPWRVDRYASASERVHTVGVPKPLPSNCHLAPYAQHWLHFIAAGGTDYPGGPTGGCAGIAPEQTLAGSTAGLPGNTTYGFTDADGTGQAKFVVWTSLTNVSLGCGPSVPCALVAVPVEGISCDAAASDLPAADRPSGDDATAAEAACTSAGNQTVPSVAVAGKLWWSASNWRNRITIPLNFAPLPATQCASSTTAGIDIYGSELMTAATEQWDSRFCGDSKLFPVTHVQTGETQARNLLATGNTDAAYTSLAPDSGYSSPVVSAPVAMTGFAIGYAIDDAKGHQYTKLRLTPRLLAKLLTESYPTILDIKNGWAHTPNSDTTTDYSALAGNPLNMSLDPEFIALNPGITEGVSSTFGAATLLMLSSDSDVVRALTSYINADPEARAWLDGASDPWGMVVNPNYRGIHLPVDNWPLLDTYEPSDIYHNDTNPCLQDNPVPYLPLVASPMTRLNLVSLNLQYAIQQSQVVCTGASTSNPKLAANGPQSIGSRFIIGITSLADADRYRIDIASLQAKVAADAPAKFNDATGRSFVAPTDDGLRAAAGLLAPDTSAGIWRLPYDRLVGGSGSSTAYPGAMLVSMAVPTKGLPAPEPDNYATFLRFVVGLGQTPGGAAGQLPDGYLPLTAANGLGAQLRYTQVAAQYVSAQEGKVPDLGSPTPLPTPHPSDSSTPAATSTPPPSSTPPADGSVTPAGDAPGGATSPSPSAGSSTPTPSPSTSGITTPSTSPAAATQATKAVDAGWLGTILPLLLLVGLIAGLAVPLLGRRGRGRA